MTPLLPAYTASPRADLEALVDRVWCVDALDLLKALPPQSIDVILTDLPYGTTACPWGMIIPFEPLWIAIRHCLKPRGVFVTTSQQPFTSMLVTSNLKWFRYEWIVQKPQGTGYLNANRQPMKNHENILVFTEGEHYYSPQMRNGKSYRATSGTVGGFIRDKTVGGYLTINNGSRYPLTVMDFEWEKGLHPTQKPVALYEYLIRTYTQPGDVILDPFIGSSTTAVAARNLGRHFIGGDITPEYVEIARKRLAMPYTLPMFERVPAEVTA